MSRQLTQHYTKYHKAAGYVKQRTSCGGNNWKKKKKSLGLVLQDIFTNNYGNVQYRVAVSSDGNKAGHQKRTG